MQCTPSPAPSTLARLSATYAIGVTLDEPHLLTLTLYNANTLTPDELESKLPGMVDNIRIEHQRLLALVARRTVVR